jgi:hypothetical protein
MAIKLNSVNDNFEIPKVWKLEKYPTFMNLLHGPMY